jgi:hypothetical protein
VPRPAPTEAEQLAGRALLRRLGCDDCHAAATTPGVTPRLRAPALSLAASRLEDAWLRQWLLDPEPWLPGAPRCFPLVATADGSVSPLPEYFGGDVMRQIDAIAAVLLAPGAHTP